ncbi:amidase [Propylenella binzhouense]|uniref:Amidase n=1 Tax=Propylenella binzhouense TaxID=2555902 RepID=A0A964T344_9HYPH|nr:amidase [Propylenella binzhouense]MYZ47588.1 amidase [Propylenella binzhouense]
MNIAGETVRLETLDATALARGIAAGAFTSEAVMRACLDRIAEREPDVRAWAHLDAEAALAAARAFDRSGRTGPLGGVPFGVKDIIDTADLPTEWGTPIHRGRRAGRDAACVALSRKAGAVLLGKTVTTEFANLHVGPTRNPTDLDRTPGGSSSGSAAAVADFMVPLAIGTQTTGSTVRPSSFCGIFGYRPTYGEHRLHGVMEASGSLDTLGICARSLADVALYRDVLLGVPPEPVGRRERPPRIGLCRTHVWPQVDPTVQRRVEEAVDRLARAGASVTEIEMPAGFEALTDAHRWISSFEFVRNLAWEIETRWDGISDTLRGGRIADGLDCPLARYIACIELAETCRARMATVWEEVDVLVGAAATGEAPLGWDAFAGADLYKMWTALHVPALTLPLLEGPNGRPVGLHFVGARHGDRALFACADWAWRQLA